MTASLLLLFAAVVAILLVQPVSIRATWHDGAGDVRLRYLGLGVRVPGRSKATPETPPTRRTRRSMARGTVWRFKRAGPDVARALWSGIRYLLRRTRVERLVVHGRLGIDDPAATGALWGLIESIRGLLPAAPEAASVDLAPDFAASRSTVTLDAIVWTRAGTLILTPAVIAWRLPAREFWRAWRSHQPRHTEGASR